MGTSHGLWCGARTYPTRCRECSEDVFFFQCRCGSMVFFDELGGSWPQHDCDRSWGRSLHRVLTPGGGVAVTIAPGVTAVRAPRRDPVYLVPSADEIIDVEVRRIDWGAPIEAMAPPPGSTQDVVVVGVVRELLPGRDPFACLELGRGTLFARGLGVLDRASTQVTIHASSPEPDGPVESYTAFVDPDLMSGIGRRDTVVAELVVVTVPGTRRSLWLVDDVFVV